jgi:peroxiredoxin
VGVRVVKIQAAALVMSAVSAIAPVLAAEGQTTPDTSVCSAAAMTPARNFLLRDVDNRKWTFSSTRGKVVLVDFWATWCVPCKVEIPAFVDMYARYKSQGLEIVGISMDAELPAIKAFAAEYKMTYPILVGAGADGVTRAWGVEGLPTTLVITRDGKICQRFSGQTSPERFEDIIKRLL